MKVSHFVPNEEKEIHTLNPECLCCPVLIPSNSLHEVEDLKDEICYEHHPFNELIDKENYIVLEEP